MFLAPKNQELSKAIADYRNRPLTLPELFQARSVITKLYNIYHIPIKDTLIRGLIFLPKSWITAGLKLRF